MENDTMNEPLLKGNFKVKNPVKLEEPKTENKSKLADYRQKALASVGGSMVYMERTQKTWDGDES